MLKTTGTTRHENRRAEKVAVLVEGQAAFGDLVRLLVQIGTTTEPEQRLCLLSKLDDDRLSKIFQAVAASSYKFALYGFDDVARASNKVLVAGALAHDALNSRFDSVIDARQVLEDGKAIDAALKRAMRSLK